MLNILALLLFLIGTYVLYNKKNKFIFFVVILLVVWDTFSFIGSGGFSIYYPLKYMIVVIFQIIYLINNLTIIAKNKILTFFGTYIFALIIFTGNYISIISSIELVIPMIMFAISYHYFDSLEKVRKMYRPIIILYFIFVLNFIFANTFNIGDDPYGFSIYGGSLTREKSFFILVGIIITPLFGYLSDRNNRLLFSLTALSIVIIFLNMRRSPILSLIIGFSIIILFYHNKITKRVFLLSLVTVGSVIILFVFDFASIVTYQLDQRGRSLDVPITEQIESETRTREIETVIDEALYTKNYFGTGLFSQSQIRGVYGYGQFRDRSMHTSLARIIYGSGIFGIILYIIFQLIILVKTSLVYFNNDISSIRYVKILFGTFISLWIVGILNLYTLGHFEFTYATLHYLFLGLIAAQIDSIKSSAITNDGNKYMS